MNLLSNIQELAKMIAIRMNANNIRYMANPSERLQIASVLRQSGSIKHIGNPCRMAQIIAVSASPENIRNIKDLCPSAQLIAVEKDTTLLKDIANPCKSAISLADSLTTSKNVISGNSNTSSQSQVSDGEMKFFGGRRSMSVKDGKATITANGENFDATKVLKSFKSNGFKIESLPGKTMNRLLKGEKVAMPGIANKLFGLVKGPTGYALKAFELVKQMHNAAQQEM